MTDRTSLWCENKHTVRTFFFIAILRLRSHFTKVWKPLEWQCYRMGNTTTMTSTATALLHGHCYNLFNLPRNRRSFIMSKWKWSIRPLWLKRWKVRVTRLFPEKEYNHYLLCGCVWYSYPLPSTTYYVLVPKESKMGSYVTSRLLFIFHLVPIPLQNITWTRNRESAFSKGISRTWKM